MSFRSKLADWIRPKEMSDSVSGMLSVTNQNTAPRRGTAELFKAYANSPWLQAVTSKIAYHMATVPWKLYGVRRGRSGKFARAYGLQDAHPMLRHKMYRQLKQAGELVEIEDHPVLELLHTANPEMSGVSARKVSQIHLDLKGEVFWLLERNRLGKPMEYWPIPPNWVIGIPAIDKPFFEVVFGAKRKSIPREDMVYIRSLDPANPLGRGVGIGESLMDEIDTDEYAAKVVKNFFFNSGRPDLIVGLQGANKETIQQAQAMFDQRFRGYQNMHRTMWTTGKLTIKELAQNFKDMQMLDLRSWERDVFINVFGVPPEIMGLLESSNRATISEALRILCTTVLEPRLELWRPELQRQLVDKFDSRAVLDYESPNPDDEDFELEAMKAAPWAATVGEWRERMGLEDRGPVDAVHMIPLNLMPTPAALSKSHGFELSPPSKDLPMLSVNKDHTVDLIAEAADGQVLVDETAKLWEDEIKAWRASTAAELGISETFQLMTPEVIQHLEHYGTTKIKGLVNKTTRDRLRSTLSEGLQAGEGYRDLSKRVRHVFDVADKARADTIAVTEAHVSSNWATMQTFQDSGLIEKKEWISVIDATSRDTHAAADGQVQPLAVPFDVGGQSVMSPGDFADAGDACNCRCTVGAHVEIPKSFEDRREIWKAYDAKLTAWANRGAAALRRGFAKQELAVLKRLGDLIG